MFEHFILSISPPAFKVLGNLWQIMFRQGLANIIRLRKMTLLKNAFISLFLTSYVCSRIRWSKAVLWYRNVSRWRKTWILRRVHFRSCIKFVNSWLDHSSHQLSRQQIRERKDNRYEAGILRFRLQNAADSRWIFLGNSKLPSHRFSPSFREHLVMNRFAKKKGEVPSRTKNFDNS